MTSTVAPSTGQLQHAWGQRTKAEGGESVQAGDGGGMKGLALTRPFQPR
jgi:hypothetical protein